MGDLFEFQHGKIGPRRIRDLTATPRTTFFSFEVLREKINAVYRDAPMPHVAVEFNDALSGDEAAVFIYPGCFYFILFYLKIYT